MKKVKLQAIAVKSGVSVATVSRILSKKKLRNTPTERAVIAAARALGYPYLPTKNGSSEYKRVIFITQLEEGEFYIELFRGFHNASTDTNYRFNLVSVRNIKDPVDEIVDTINAHHAACIFLPGLTEQDYIKIKERCYKIPILSLAPIPSPVIDTITFDSYSGGNIIAKHFYNSGFNDVGIIYGAPHLTESNYRKNGFLDFVNSKSSMNLQWVFNGDYSIESGREAFHDYMKNGHNKGIAIFSCNDGMSLGFITEANNAGVKIPENIRIAGYDNIPMCENLHPSLTTIATNFHNIGEQAILYLDQKFAKVNANGQDEFSKGHLYLVPVNLVERLSTRK